MRSLLDGMLTYCADGIESMGSSGVERCSVQVAWITTLIVRPEALGEHVALVEHR